MQQRGIAERMYQAFPEVFKGEPQMSARSTVVIRCVLRYGCILRTPEEFNPKMRIGASSNKIYGLPKFHTQEAMVYFTQRALV